MFCSMHNVLFHLIYAISKFFHESMLLLFTIHKTLVTFNLTLNLNVRIPDIQKLSRDPKGYLISQNF